MLYILLALIAIGVLLLSKEGKTILNFFTIVLKVLGKPILILISLLIILVILKAIFKEDFNNFLLIVIVGFIIALIINDIWHKRGEIKEKINKTFSWKRNKYFIISCTPLIIGIPLIVLIYIIITDLF